MEWRSGYTVSVALGGVPSIEHDKTTKDAEMRILNVLTEFQRLHKDGLLEPALESLCEQLSRAIYETPKAGKAGHKAARAVGLLRNLWWRNTEKEAPRTLNRASPFADYLTDGFKYLRVGGKPMPAMRLRAKTQ